MKCLKILNNLFIYTTVKQGSFSLLFEHKPPCMQTLKPRLSHRCTNRFHFLLQSFLQYNFTTVHISQHNSHFSFVSASIYTRKVNFGRGKVNFIYTKCCRLRRIVDKIDLQIPTDHLLTEWAVAANELQSVLGGGGHPFPRSFTSLFWQLF